MNKTTLAMATRTRSGHRYRPSRALRLGGMLLIALALFLRPTR